MENPSQPPKRGFECTPRIIYQFRIMSLLYIIVIQVYIFKEESVILKSWVNVQEDNKISSLKYILLYVLLYVTVHAKISLI